MAWQANKLELAVPITAERSSETAAALYQDAQLSPRDYTASGRSTGNDITALNQSLGLGSAGFPDDFQLVGDSGGANRILAGSGGQTTDSQAYPQAVERVDNAVLPPSQSIQYAQYEALVEPAGVSAGSTETGSASNYTVQKGDTLWGIAKNSLPDGASKQDIANRIKEIAAANGVDNPDQIHPGESLFIPDQGGGNSDTKNGDTTSGVLSTPNEQWPTGTAESGIVGALPVQSDSPQDAVPVGHTSDGGTVTLEANGDVKTTWDDGTVRVASADGTHGSVTKPDGSVHHWGPKPGDNYDIDSNGTLVHSPLTGWQQGQPLFPPDNPYFE